MTKNAVSVYVFSSLLYLIGVFVYKFMLSGNFSGYYFVYAIAVAVSASIVMFVVNRTKTDRFPMFVYLLLPLISPILVAGFFIWLIFTVLRFVFTD